MSKVDLIRINVQDSKVLTSILYFKPASTAVVRFITGKIYSYENVPFSQIVEIVESEDAGKTFMATIRKNTNCIEITDEKAKETFFRAMFG